MSARPDFKRLDMLAAKVDAAIAAEGDPSMAPTPVAAGAFLSAFKPIEPIVDGLPVGRGGLVSVTGATGSGKTTLCGLLQLAFCCNRQFAGREVTAGSVLVLAGENPDDYAMHLMATLQEQRIEPAELDSNPARRLLVIPGTFDVAFTVESLQAHIAQANVSLNAVFVDTSAAFFMAQDENDNVAMRRHASTLRELSTLPGKPTVFVLCHPVKSATKDNLIPRGGGAFLAEVDANLTVANADGVITLHWQGKIRGTPFEPIRFELVTVQLEGRLDCRGRPIASTAARHIPDERAEQLEAKSLDDENRLMVAMQRKPGGSIRDLCMAGGFTHGVGTPATSKVSRLLQKLKAETLVEKSRTGVWQLTSKGRNEADRLP